MNCVFGSCLLSDSLCWCHVWFVWVHRFTLVNPLFTCETQAVRTQNNGSCDVTCSASLFLITVLNKQGLCLLHVVKLSMSELSSTVNFTAHARARVSHRCTIKADSCTAALVTEKPSKLQITLSHLLEPVSLVWMLDTCAQSPPWILHLADVHSA